MLSINSLIQDYILDDASLFNEYDTTSFITSANNALGKISVNFSSFILEYNYTKFLESSIKYLNDINIDSFDISKFTSNILNSQKIDKSGIFIKDINKTGTIIFKLQYLDEFILKFKYKINDIINGDISISAIKDECANISKYVDITKKRAVTTDIPYSNDPKEFIKHESYISVPVTSAYLNDVVIPYIKNFPKLKQNIIKDVLISKNIISSCFSNLQTYMNTLDSMNIEHDKKNILLNYCYNFIHGFMDICSYIIYLNLRKIHIAEENIVAIQNVYNQLTLLFNSEVNMIESGAYNSRLITAVDENNLVDSLLDGKVDAYTELANNIMEYHKGYLCTRINADTNSSDFIDHSIEEYGEYNKALYDDLIKMYIEIGNGLEILAKNSDDYLMVFDDIINKSGFGIPLQDRFSSRLEAIKKMDDYSITNLNIGNGGEKSDVYLQILSEINDYPNNIQKIADTAKEMWTKLEYVESIFKSEKNGELGYSETMNELKVFIETLREQYKLVNRTMTNNLYQRLKLLAEKADECLDNVGGEDKTDPSSLIDIDNRDFLGEAVIAIAEWKDDLTDLYLEMFMKDYYAEREYIEKGIRLIYEADNNSNSSSDNSGNSSSKNDSSSNNNKPKTDVVVNDNSSEKGSTKLDGGKLQNILKRISDFFKKLIDAFKSLINNNKQKNTEWLKNHKDDILNRSYANVQIQILPYDKGPQTNKIDQDISAFSTNIAAMNRANIEKVGSYEDLRSKLIQFGIQFTKDTDEKVTITNYYKVGKGKMEVVTYSNNEIKSYIQNYMIPYCEAFYNSYYESLKNKLDNISNNMTNIVKTYVTESAIAISNMNIFTEAEDIGGATVQLGDSDSAKNATNMSEKAEWMQKCAANYIGSVLTALRDRNNDYFKVLFALAPKKSNNTESNTQSSDDNSNNDNNDNSENK